MRGLAVACIVALLIPVPAAQPARSIPAGSASLAGRVIDRDSRLPLANVIVTLTRGVDDGELTTLTDKNGAYVFESVGAGSYRVSASLDGYVHEEFGRTPILELQYNGRSVRLSPGAVSFNLNDAQVRRGVDFALVRAGSISGRIVDAEGKPLRDAVATAILMRPDSGYLHMASSRARTNEHAAASTGFEICRPGLIASCSNGLTSRHKKRRRRRR